MKKVLRAALPLGMLALALSMPAKATGCDDYCLWEENFCLDGCTGINDSTQCRFHCYEGYLNCDALNCSGEP